MSHGYFPGKKRAKRSGIITPRTAQEELIPAMPCQTSGGREALARQLPLLHEHINMLGRYSFSVPDSVARGELRPLRDPTDGPA